MTENISREVFRGLNWGLTAVPLFVILLSYTHKKQNKKEIT